MNGKDHNFTDSQIQELAEFMQLATELHKEKDELRLRVQSDFWNSLFSGILKRHSYTTDFFLVSVKIIKKDVAERFRLFLKELCEKYEISFLETSSPFLTEFKCRFSSYNKENTFDELSIVICLSDISLRMLPCNPMIKSFDGIGKSQILEKFYSEKGYKVVTLFLGQMSDPGDLIGIPHKNEATGHTEFMPPYWFSTDEMPVVLFLDELNRARPEVLQTIMDLALNRKLAGRSLPKGSRIISAVNNGEEYQLTDLDPTLVSRFNIYEFVPSVQDWLLWAVKNGIDERVTSYISANPNALDNQKALEDLDNLEKTPDRRGWVRVSEIIIDKNELKQSHRSMIAEIVGGVAANRFFEFLDQNHLLTAKELLLGDFGTNFCKLETYKTPQLATINDAVFVFLESCKYDDCHKPIIAKNLESYFGYLEEKGLREAMAHFANMFSGTMYPNALVFIIGECPDLYTRMTKFVSEIR